ncbi:MAG: hypothetical protein HY770_07925 [Chitinivibrionia bacterium]|nr:hypothetical protein [Chitinivibrionia bacterium]
MNWLRPSLAYPDIFLDFSSGLPVDGASWENISGKRQASLSPSVTRSFKRGVALFSDWSPIMEAMQNLPTFEFENEQNRIIDLLDRHLASAIDLQLRIRHALWNAEDRDRRTDLVSPLAIEVGWQISIIANQSGLKRWAEITPPLTRYCDH